MTETVTSDRATPSTNINARLNRDSIKEAAAALNFWQSIEYLAYQSPPKAKVGDCVWEMNAKTPYADMPWNHRDKSAILQKIIGPNRRFQIFSGIVNGEYLVEAARQHLGAAPLDISERMTPAPIACVVLGVNGMGMATGQVFISTVPWAMRRIIENHGKNDPLSFRGFFGIGGLDEQIKAKVVDLLVERKLLEPESPQGGSPVMSAASTTLGASLDAKSNETYEPLSRASSATGSKDSPSGGNGQLVQAVMTGADNLRQITADDIDAITQLVFTLCGWHPERQENWRIKGIKTPEKDDNNEAAQDDPLNSFYAEDIEHVSDAWSEGDVGKGLQEYLRGEDSIGRIDLDKSVTELINGVHPSLQPKGCWPAKYPLVTAQQFAVNAIMRELAGSGIFAVNGPPGTGKTTMLKDIVAAIVVSRADILMEFNSPESAFGRRLEIENYQYPVFELDKRLRGFGVVVSSANNGAVENISKELPGLSSIASDLNVDYFSLVADSLAAPPKAKQRNPIQQHWGLVAAVLGNKSNRNLFASRFWLAGLLPKNKKGKENELPPTQDPMRLRSLQDLIQTREDGAMSWENARTRYRLAKEKVDAIIEKTARALAAMQTLKAELLREKSMQAEISAIQVCLPRLQEVATSTKVIAETAEEKLRLAASKVKSFQAFIKYQATTEQTKQKLLEQKAQMPADGLLGAQMAHAQAVKDLQDLREDHEIHQKKKPGFLAEIFKTESSKRWNTRDEQFEKELRDARRQEKATASQISEVNALTQQIAGLQLALESAEHDARQVWGDAQRIGVEAGDTESAILTAFNDCKDDLSVKHAAAAQAEMELATAHQRLVSVKEQFAQSGVVAARAKEVLDSAGFPENALKNWDLAMQDRDAMHSASPYMTEELFAAKREVFIAAMELHKAFIVAAWKKLARSLSAFVNVLNGSLGPSQIRDGVTQLWDAFFLVVPLVSTTFASLPRLFSGVKREELAWLLIDEAGQAAPQQAVGAIWRAKRTVIVGDPLQLEPVVSVPNEIIAALLKRCAAEAQWAPPVASAQTLADRANRLGMYLGEQGSDTAVWLGSPLLVHRRCINPMFKIANSIAYENKMVYGGGEDSGGAGIGPSRWIDMPATVAEGHWIEEQGRKALELVHQLTAGNLRGQTGQFKVYVITPFKTVSEKMRDMLYAHYKDASKGMVGTVHTFQGKEAEHVIFLLGGNPKSPGVISSFAGAKPNLVNVAVTRAKRRLYVIGNQRYWTGAADVNQIFTRMAGHLEIERS